MNVIRIGGLPFSRKSFQKSLDWSSDVLKRSGSAKSIYFANAYSVVLAQEDTELFKAFCQADLLLPDGMSIVWASRMQKASLPERVPGPNYTLAICQLAQESGASVFLLGSNDVTLESMRNTLVSRFPQIKIAGQYAPPYAQVFSAEMNTTMIATVNDSGAKILLVGLSCPKQEKWIHDHLSELHVALALGVGAAFDFIAGNIRRAPMWMQQYGLEWFYRLLQEPTRLWKRYLLGNMQFLLIVVKERLLKRGHHG